MFTLISPILDFDAEKPPDPGESTEGRLRTRYACGGIIAGTLIVSEDENKEKGKQGKKKVESKNKGEGEQAKMKVTEFMHTLVGGMKRKKK